MRILIDRGEWETASTKTIEQSGGVEGRCASREWYLYPGQQLIYSPDLPCVQLYGPGRTRYNLSYQMSRPGIMR